MSVESINTLDIRGLYDALPQQISITGSSGKYVPLDIHKADYFPANTTRNATTTDIFEVDAVAGIRSINNVPRIENTHLTVEDTTPENYTLEQSKRFSVCGEYSQKDVYGLIPFLTKKYPEFGVHGSMDAVKGKINFEAYCIYDEITPASRAVTSLQATIIDVAELWRQLQEQAAKNTNPIR